MSSKRDLITAIKESKKDGDYVKLKFNNPTFKIPVNIKDRKAVQIIEQLFDDEELADLTIGDILEIFQFGIFWLEYFQLLSYQDKEP